MSQLGSKSVYSEIRERLLKWIRLQIMPWMEGIRIPPT